MTTESDKKLDQLRRAYESGILDEETYRAAVAGLQNAGNNRTVTADTIHGPVATGDNVRQIQAETYYERFINQTDPTAPDEADLRRAYLSHLWGQTRGLALTGVDPAATGSDGGLNLDAVYTALLTYRTEMNPDNDHTKAILGIDSADTDLVVTKASEIYHDDKLITKYDMGFGRLSAVNLLNRENRLVLLGDPGSGKSTFVNFVALCLAGEALEQPDANLTVLTAPLPADEDDRSRDRDEAPPPQPWNHGSLLPVRVILRDFAARGLPEGETPTANHVWDFIEGELRAASLGDYAPYLRNHLLDRGGLILLDGLDEVPEAERRREQICAAVSSFANAYGRCRILVTSRTYAYQKQAWKLSGFAEAVLAPFSDAQIRAFVARWYAHWAALRRSDDQDAAGRAELLRHAIFNSARLRELAERPLLLTLMASLHAWRGGTLPDRREELYADAVDLLLDRWESQRVVRDARGTVKVTQRSLQEFLRVDRSALQALLNRLAFEAHRSQSPEETGTADIASGDLLTGLLAISQNPDVQSDSPVNVGLLVNYLSDRAGLLVPRGVNVYSFPHRTFQEYLAAWHLTDEDYPDQIAELARTDPNRWREVALLAGAKAARGTASAIWQLVDALCYRQPEDEPWCIEDDWGAHLAGQALSERGPLKDVSERNRGKFERVQGGLLHLMRQSDLPALERAAAGRTLAALGDPRPAVMTVEGMHFCCVPAGSFEMGESSEQHTVDLDSIYWIGKFAITNAQYARFVAAEGYANPDYWFEAQEAGYWEDGSFDGRTAAQTVRTPLHLPNHPVVGVTWYEALACTRWLTEHLRAEALLPADWTIRLPSEAEWEKAARGGHQIPVEAHGVALDAVAWDGIPALRDNQQRERRYPWGDAPDTDRMNYNETELNGTNAAGCFPLGVSPYGVEELSGTVWEWTRSIYADNYPYPYDPDDGREALGAPGMRRVLRGGSFGSRDVNLARAAFRFHYLPDLANSYLGFRVVASPLL